MKQLSNSTSTYTEETLTSDIIYTLASVILLFIGIFGFLFNLSVIILIWKDKKLWTPLNLILFNLASSDFCVAILGTPWTFFSSISHEWIFGRVMCKLYGFFMSLLGISSITTLAVLAFERYVIVSQPFRNQGLKYSTATYLIIAIWLYSLILTTPPLFGWGKYVNEAANISCSVNWEEKSFNAMTYIVYLFCFGLVVPLTIIIFSYINIMLTMRKSTMKMSRVNKAEGQFAFVVFIMIVAFLIAWSPYAVLALIVQFGQMAIITPSVAIFPALLAKTSICYNPIIYFGLNTQFRQSLRQILERSKDKSNTYSTLALKWMSQMTQYETEDRLKCTMTTNVFLKNNEVENEIVEVSEKSENECIELRCVDGKLEEVIETI